MSFAAVGGGSWVPRRTRGGQLNQGASLLSTDVKLSCPNDVEHVQRFAYLPYGSIEGSALVVELSTRRPLAPEDCVALLATTDVGWLAISTGARPAIVPVNFIVLSDQLVFRAERQGELHRATVGAVVAIETGPGASGTCRAWSVHVQGVASELVSASLLDAIGERWTAHWQVAAGAPAFIGLPTRGISGWEFHHPDGSE